MHPRVSFFSVEDKKHCIAKPYTRARDRDELQQAAKPGDATRVATGNGARLSSRLKNSRQP